MNSPLVNKLTGADMELGNFISGFSDGRQTGYEASRLLLGKIRGIACEERRAGSSTPGASGVPEGFYSQDYGRKFLDNGACFYIDLNHLEACIPEVRSAWDHLAATHAAFALAARAAEEVNAEMPDGFRMEVMANNSDGLGNSYGSHLNVLVSRRLWEDLFHRRIQCQLLLASFQASSIVFTGQGKVGTENRRAPLSYQVSQRADFCEVLSGPQTTYHRPIVNSRDEPLCGAPEVSTGAGQARLHVICYDNNLCHVATILKVGTLQLLLATLESGWLDLDLVLDQPVDALQRFSRDPGLEVRVPLMNGVATTAVELQQRFLEAAHRFVDSGQAEEVVPEAGRILQLWQEMLDLLARRDFEALAPCLDWVLKRSLLVQAMKEQELSWEDPALKYLDHLYSHLDPCRGLYWAMQRSGFTRQLATQEQVRHRMEHAPEDTRAWTRSLFLRLTDPAWIECVNWDRLRFSIPGAQARHAMPRRMALFLGNPLEHGRESTTRRLRGCATIEQMAEALGARECPPEPSRGYHSNDNPQTQGNP